MSAGTEPSWKRLGKYSACDIADALLKLGVPGAGYVADILPLLSTQRTSTTSTAPKILAPASTILMLPKPTPSFPSTSTPPNPAPIPSNIPPGTPFSDLTSPDTIVVVSQPEGQTCAVVGGIHGLRMARLGVKGLVVDGRVRDVGTLGSLEREEDGRRIEVPVWTRGTSVVGAGAQTKFWARDVEVRVGEITVQPGDIVMLDAEERGVVVVPAGLVDKILEEGMLPKMVQADGKVEDAVREGMSVAEAFGRFRG